jgi:DNA-binding Lrp family transcriptional regulator
MSNSRTPYHELAGKLGLSINAVHKRIRAMIEAGIIRAFTAQVSLLSLGAITVWVFGRSAADHPDQAHLRLKDNDSTYWIANSGGGYLYVGGYLRSLSELDDYVSFVMKEGAMPEPTVGIVPQQTPRFTSESLRPLDYQILASLHRNSRKPVTEVASEVHVSPKTVHHRLERIVEMGLADFSIDFYPDASNDIISICHVSVARTADRMKVLSSLRERFSQNILVNMLFSNLPNQLALFLWTNSMRQMDDLKERIAKAEGVGSVQANVLQIGYIFETWRDKLLPEGGGKIASPAS